MFLEPHLESFDLGTLTAYVIEGLGKDSITPSTAGICIFDVDGYSHPMNSIGAIFGMKHHIADLFLVPLDVNRSMGEGTVSARRMVDFEGQAHKSRESGAKNEFTCG